jgi:hypothetical protein
VAQQPAKTDDTPVPESTTQPTDERDTLNDTPELRFLRDEIEALLGATAVRGASREPAINYEDRVTAEFDTSIYERDTEPSIDVKLLREASRVAGK